MRIEDFVGREAEARALLSNTVARHASLLIGEAGMGKTALLDYLADALHDIGTPIFLGRVTPFGTFLRELFEGLWEAGLTENRSSELQGDWKAFGKRYSSNDEKARALCDRLRELGSQPRAKNVILVIDDATGITPTTRPWLELLSEACTVIAAVTPDALARKGSKRFWKRFSEVKLGPLSKREGQELLAALMTRYRIIADEPEIYQRRVLDLAQGSPFELGRLVKYHSTQALVKTGELLSYGQEFVERDEKGVVLAPLLLVIGAFTMALRYVARAQGDVDMYILAAIATVLVIVCAPWLRSSLRPRSR